MPLWTSGIYFGDWTQVSLLTFSPDGLTLAAVPRPSGKCAELVNATESGHSIGHGAPITALALSSVDSVVATGGTDGFVKLRTRSGGDYGAPLPHASPITALAFDPACSRLAVGEASGRIRVWNFTDPVPQSFVDYEGAETSPVVMRFHPSGSGLVAVFSGADTPTSTVRGWRFNEPTSLYCWEHPNQLTDAAFAPDGEHLVTGAAHGSLRVWHLASGHLVREIDTDHGAIHAVACWPNTWQVATGGEDKITRVWDRDGNLVQEFRHHYAAVRTLDVSVHGVLAAGGDDGYVITYQPETWRVSGLFDDLS